MSSVETMSAAELKAALKKKQADEKAAKANAKKGYDQLRDSYIETVFSKMEELSAQLRDFKGESVKLGIELHTKMYQTLGREPKDGIDSYTLTSADGLRRVSIERQWRCEYDETSTVAIDTIKAVLRDKFEGRNKSMYRIIDDILSKNGTGDYDERLVARLRKHEEAVDDKRFSEALDILAKAYKPTTSQMYIRAYRREPGGKWRDVVMNWSAM